MGYRPHGALRRAALFLALCLLLTAFTPPLSIAAPPSPAVASRAPSRGWQQTAVYKDPSAPIPSRVADLLARMTLDEKIGQMTQPDRSALASASDIATYGLGSLLSGGGSAPTPNTPAAWADMYDSYQRVAVGTRLGIPLIYGIDAVHGHNNVYGATIFPHNIGLGATRNPALLQQIGQATAEEIAGTGIDWDFAPCLCVSRDERWGRTYESYGEDPALAQSLTTYITGLQGPSLSGPASILATAKHYVGDGGTSGGVNEGDTQLSEAQLRAIHLPPFRDAVQRGVGSVMVSYSSWNGAKMHGNRYLITDVLKGELGFTGFVVSDWAGIDQLPGDYASDVRASINAGLDMIMVPYDYKLFISTLRSEVASGSVPMARIDDAVRRILTKKFELGLFERPYTDRTYTATVGSAAHRALARDAVRQSLVLLKNTNSILPLAKTGRLFVAGKNADDIGNQSGGWTISWQGSSGNNTPGTTILQGIRAVAPGSTVTYSRTGAGIDSSYQAAVVVVGETPYAETKGDRTSLALDSEDLSALSAVKASGVPTVVVLVSGRPMNIAGQLPDWAAFIAAWLPGTEGQGVADVLFGDYKPTGKLPVSWPRSESQLPINVGDAVYDPLFPYGFGLTYGTSNDTQPPSAPANLSAPSKTSTSVALSWTASTDNVGVTGYDVFIGASATPAAGCSGVGGTSCTATGLSPGTSYSLSVKAKDAAGNTSAASAPLSVTTSLAQSNLALNRPVTASSSESATYSPSLAVDGSASTRWSSAFGDPQWLQVDLGAQASISRVVLSWEAAYASAYQIQVSSAATGPWTTLYSTASGGGGTADLTVSGTGRYVRVYGTQRATPYGYSLYELEVYGSTAPVQTNLALNRPATASSSEAATYSPSLAVDGSASTRWSSAFSDPQWLQVDLGAQASISRVVLTWEAAYASAYQIQAAPVATGPWTTLYSTASGSGGTADLTVSGTGRYVRVYGTQRATPYGYSLYELEVYGSLTNDSGTGLRGDYFDNMDLTAPKLTRTDATVNFDWGTGSPDPSAGADTFSARWTGDVQPAFSETYTFFTTSDDGIRLWINGVQLINNWTDHGPVENSGTIALTAGQRYAVRLEYYENGGGAVSTLSWSSASQPKQIIPQSKLFPGDGSVPPGTGSFVAQHGRLKVVGGKLVDKNNQPIQLRGMSSHGLQWYGQYMNQSSVSSLAADWGATVVRAAMYVDEGGYLANQAGMKQKVKDIVQYAETAGIYVIIDWHMLTPGDPNAHLAESKAFWQEMAALYKDKEHVLYEIANEPNGVSWNSSIKPYAEQVIASIRALDPSTVIIVGTGDWSQKVDDAAANPLSGSNIMYTLHFYTGTHTQWLRDRADAAMARGIAIFVTEWGTSEASGNGGPYLAEAQLWVDWMRARGISWTNWSLCDKSEVSAALVGGTSTSGGWTDANLTASGRFVRGAMR